MGSLMPALFLDILGACISELVGVSAAWRSGG